MLCNGKVIWKEGMFLQPQHFQQAERFTLNAINAAINQNFPYAYGISELTIDKDAAANGLIAITRCSGRLSDGVIFDIPKEDAAPAARSFTEHFSHDQQSLDLYLALPLCIEGKTNVASAPQAAVRYTSRETTVVDEVQGAQKKKIETGTLNFTVLFGGESMDNHTTLHAGKLVRTPSGAVELIEGFIPPLLSIGASLTLLNLLRSLLELLLAKINSLSQGRRQVEGGMAEFTSGEETSFRLLQTLNTFTPMLNHYHFVPTVHPFDLFSILTQCAGALCTFSAEVSLKNLPRYEHGNLAATFTQLIKVIRTVLEANIAAGCVPAPIEQINTATYVCRIPDDKLLSIGKFYLGVSAKVPEKELIVGVLQRIKLSSRNQLDLLISSAMPGLPLIHSIHPPEGLSTKPGFVYFKLDQQGDFWNAIKTSGTMAFYFPNNYQELKLEMLALKE
jgi:type VI secretion system protein ImpJ